MNFAEGIQIKDFLIIEDVLPIMVNSTGIRIYDFNFRMYFNSKSIYGEVKKPVIARIGAPNDYKKLYNELKDSNIELVHTPEEHERCSLLPIWFPIVIVR